MYNAMLCALWRAGAIAVIAAARGSTHRCITFDQW
jgi:hypothetical protein